jgi:hypothetical protein
VADAGRGMDGDIRMSTLIAPFTHDSCRPTIAIRSRRGLTCAGRTERFLRLSPRASGGRPASGMARSGSMMNVPRIEPFVRDMLGRRARPELSACMQLAHLRKFVGRDGARLEDDGVDDVEDVPKTEAAGEGDDAAAAAAARAFAGAVLPGARDGAATTLVCAPNDVADADGRNEGAPLERLPSSEASSL